MNLFQYLTLPIIAFLFIRSLIALGKGGQSKFILVFRVVVWLIAGIAILRPDLTILTASFLGIGRGADLVLYLLVIVYLITFFYTYNRFQKLESSITEIVRQIALQNPSQNQEDNLGQTNNNIDLISEKQEIKN